MIASTRIKKVRLYDLAARLMQPLEFPSTPPRPLLPPKGSRR